MTRAEEQALRAYPRADDAWGDEWQKRVGFVEGYNQAIKDTIGRINNWERDFDDYYLTFDREGFARIEQIKLKEDLINLITNN